MCPSHLNYSSNCHIVRERETDRDRDGRTKGSKRRKLSREGKNCSQTNTSPFRNSAIQQIHICGVYSQGPERSYIALTACLLLHTILTSLQICLKYSQQRGSCHKSPAEGLIELSCLTAESLLKQKWRHKNDKTGP